MKHYLAVTAIVASLIGSGATLFSPERAAASGSDPTAYVDPFIGTSGNGFDGAIDTFPGADAPFGMVQWSPDTTQHYAGGGYYYGDSAIIGFSLTHVSGPGCNAFGDIGMLPTIGAVADPANASQPFSHASESASPGYYSVYVGMPSIRTDLTVTQRTGLGSFTFPATQTANVLVNPSSDQAGVSDAQIHIAGDRDVTGYATSGGFCGMPGKFTVYFALHFNRPFAEHGTWLLKHVMPQTSDASGPGAGGWLTFDTTGDPTVKVQAALSFVSLAGAQTNLRAEAKTWDLGAVRKATAAQWSSELSRVKIDGGLPAQRRVFYTALYHAMLHPNVYSDADGSYKGFDEQIHRVDAGHTEYATFSGWDIYRTQIPLLALLEPARTSDMMRSLVHAYVQMGWLPKWSLVNAETGVMGGDPSDPMIAGAYAFGARDFDARTALSAMVKGATQMDGPRGQGWYFQRPGLDEYLNRGYVTNDHTTNVSPVPNGASLTLEYSLDDFSVAQLARALGDENTYRLMMTRAQNWSNLFDRSTGLILPRDRNGAFLQMPIGDNGQSGFQEGTAAQYTWMVPQNLAALVEGMGGRASAVAKLDLFFSQIDGGGNTPYAWMGNEPSIGSPWVYLSAGAPWKSQRVIHDVATQLWGDTPDGIPGNDDLGTMSAWYVWCALGLYPQNPAAAVLDLGAPFFPHASIRVPGGADIQIDAPSASTSRFFVRSVTLDGKPWSRSWVSFNPKASLRLNFALSDAPNERWASTTRDAPPSYALGPVTFPPSALATFTQAASSGLVLAPGASATLQFGVSNADTSPLSISWQAQPPDGLSLEPASGTLDAPAGAVQQFNAELRVASSARSGLYDISVSGKAANGAPIGAITAVVRVDGSRDAMPLVYVANNSSNSVTPIDPRTHAFGAPIGVGKGPRDLQLSPDGKRLYVANEGSNDVSVIDTMRQQVVANVKVGKAPFGVRVAPGGATIWVANHDDNTIQPIDAATLTAGSPIAVGTQPENFAITPDASMLFVSDQGSNEVTPVNLRTNQALAPIPTGLHPRGIVIAPDGKTVFTGNQGANSITVIDVATLKAVGDIPAGFQPRRIAISPDGKWLYTADVGSDTVTPVDVAARKASEPLIVGDGPYALTFDATGSTLYVVNGGDKTCVAVDVNSRQVGKPVPVGELPLAIAR